MSFTVKVGGAVISSGGNIIIRSGSCTDMGIQLIKEKFETHNFKKNSWPDYDVCQKCGLRCRFGFTVMDEYTPDGNYSCDEFIIKNIIE